MIHVRLATDADAADIVAIRNTFMPEPVTVAEWLKFEELDRQMPGMIVRRLVAVQEEKVLGYAVIARDDSTPAGMWHCFVAVDAPARRQGVGEKLWSKVSELAAEFGAAELSCYVPGTEEEGAAWAARRGFHLARQRTESVLELAGWESGRFGDALERVRAQGIRLLTLSEPPRDARMLQELYEVALDSAPDIPDFEGSLPPPETWQKNFVEVLSPRCIAVALDGEKAVGFSELYLPTVAGAGAMTDYTGVRRAYRNRGIALALKVLTVEAAVAAGAPYMRTNNDPDNPSMLAVNEKLGYRLIPGPRVMKKRMK